MSDERQNFLARLGIRWSAPSLVMGFATIAVVGTILIAAFVAFVEAPVPPPAAGEAPAEGSSADASRLLPAASNSPSHATPDSVVPSASTPIGQPAARVPDARLVARELMSDGQLERCSVRLVSRLTGDGPTFDTTIDLQLGGARAQNVVVASSFVGDPTEFNHSAHGRQRNAPVRLAERAALEREMRDCIRSKVEAYGPYRAITLRVAEGPVHLAMRTGGEPKLVSADNGAP